MTHVSLEFMFVTSAHSKDFYKIFFGTLYLEKEALAEACLEELFVLFLKENVPLKLFYTHG